MKHHITCMLAASHLNCRALAGWCPPLLALACAITLAMAEDDATEANKSSFPVAEWAGASRERVKSPYSGKLVDVRELPPGALVSDPYFDPKERKYFRVPAAEAAAKAAPSAPSTAAADQPGWKLVWSDEFDKPGQPDPAKWGYEKGLVRNNEKQFYTENRRENTRVEDGKLVIEARKEAMQGGDFTAASVISKGHGEWTYGRIEVKAKLPTARGTWPAIWMLPNTFPKVPWPLCGEIDIMEHVGHEPGKIHATLHCGAFNHTKGTQRSGNLMLPTFGSEFHTYSMDWSAERIDMRIDGKTYATMERKPGDTAAEWPFDKPFYLILNLAIGGTWGGQKGIDEAAFPQRMEVDYVRVYQKSE